MISKTNSEFWSCGHPDFVSMYLRAYVYVPPTGHWTGFIVLLSLPHCCIWNNPCFSEAVFEICLFLVLSASGNANAERQKATREESASLPIPWNVLYRLLCSTLTLIGRYTPVGCMRRVKQRLLHLKLSYDCQFSIMCRF